MENLNAPKPNLERFVVTALAWTIAPVTTKYLSGVMDSAGDKAKLNENGENSIAISLALDLVDAIVTVASLDNPAFAIAQRVGYAFLGGHIAQQIGRRQGRQATDAPEGKK